MKETIQKIRELRAEAEALENDVSTTSSWWFLQFSKREPERYAKYLEKENRLREVRFQLDSINRALLRG